MAILEVKVDVENLEKVKAIVTDAKNENLRLKLQLGKVLEAISLGNTCPNSVDLPIAEDTDCGESCAICWRKALEHVVVDDDVILDQLSSPEIATMHQDGTLCEQCGEVIGEPVGEPRLCKGCEG
ncbi:hypothetical protein [Desulfosporosinus nitroreducens]|uniref:hypothetical protein n=1 Tax=Desulfosporosinus nitroreducens TaxID=2018668 RepID=UPI00207CD81B|nr:hypothetical protein [Desulfosporosinus nitroreducens]MCO1599868.1 hypothetical protein [Desulfosporosinus nitroreducens]